MARKCKECHGNLVLREVTGHFLSSYSHVTYSNCSAKGKTLSGLPMDIIPEDGTYEVAKDSCGCGPRKSCPVCTSNPDPICPCGAWYNFTCYCTRDQINAFKAGREFEKSKSK